MRRRVSIILGLGLVAVIFSGCPQEGERPMVGERARGYWTAIFQGRARAAYEMLDSKSQGFIVYTDYARKVGLLPSQIQEVQDYWAAYYPLTTIEIQSVLIDRKSNTAVVSLTLTQPDPTWFSDEALEEAERLGLERGEKARFILRKQTEALREGRVPTVKIAENTKLVKEEDEWRIVFTR